MYSVLFSVEDKLTMNFCLAPNKLLSDKLNDYDFIFIILMKLFSFQSHRQWYEEFCFKNIINIGIKSEILEYYLSSYWLLVHFFIGKIRVFCFKNSYECISYKNLQKIFLKHRSHYLFSLYAIFGLERTWKFNLLYLAVPY